MPAQAVGELVDAPGAAVVMFMAKLRDTGDSAFDPLADLSLWRELSAGSIPARRIPVESPAATRP
jgi:hypothetical protein